MILDTKTFKIVRPDSATNADAEAYEFYLGWYGTDGGFYNWLFTDFEEMQSVTGEIVSKNSTNLTKIFESAENQILLTAENLSENQYNVISKIIRAKNVYRIFKDRTYEKLAIVKSDFNKRKSDFRYDFEIIVQKQNDIIYR